MNQREMVQPSTRGESKHDAAHPVGKTSLVENSGESSGDQAHGGPYKGSVFVQSPRQIAQEGTRGPGGALPFQDQIQKSFGRHDISKVRAHQGGDAAGAAQTLGASAFAVGDAVAFKGAPDLHTAAHEAAHIIQQQHGARLSSGMDTPGDAFEQHADAVADAVVAGRSAEALLDQVASGQPTAGSEVTVQRKTDYDLGAGLVNALYRFEASVGRVAPETEAHKLADSINARLKGHPNAGAVQSSITETLEAYASAVFNQSNPGLKRFNELVHALFYGGWISESAMHQMFGIVVSERRKFVACDANDDSDNIINAGSERVFKGTWLDKPHVRMRPARTNPAAAAKKVEEEKQEKTHENVEHAVKAVGYLTKLPLPEGAKAGVEAIHATLELMATEKGETAQYAKHVAKLGAAMFQVVGAIVKSGGMNGELAEQAAQQLGHIAGYVKIASKYFSAVDDLSKVFAGHTIGGKKCTNNERADAAIDLIKLCGGTTFGIAVTVSIEEFKWIFNTIGVPILQATADASEADLRHVLGGKSPEQLKAEISAMSCDTTKAGATIRKIYGNTFTRSSMFNTGYSIAAQWEAYRAPIDAKYGAEIERTYAEDNWVKHIDATTPTTRIEIAEALKLLAIHFIDQETRKMRESQRLPH